MHLSIFTLCEFNLKQSAENLVNTIQVQKWREKT